MVPYDAEAHRRITEKLSRQERLTPEEQLVVAQAFALMLGYLAHGVARLVAPAIQHLASAEVRERLDEMSRGLDDRMRG
jgi:hypothetical protein